MPIRFQADADLNQIIVSAVVRRVPAIDFRTATTAGLAGLKDREVLAATADDGRVLVTHDQATMPRHFREFVRSQHSRWRDRRPATSSAWGSRRRPDSHLDSDRSGGMDGSNRLLADLIEAQDTNIRRRR